jgi:hypothetical protein
MEVIKELTDDWKTDYRVPCHTYVLNKGGKCVGYRRESGEINVFAKPLAFDKKRRKFEKVVDKELLDAILAA